MYSLRELFETDYGRMEYVLTVWNTSSGAYEMSGRFRSYYALRRNGIPPKRRRFLSRRVRRCLDGIGTRADHLGRRGPINNTSEMDDIRGRSVSICQNRFTVGRVRRAIKNRYT